ncbi:hypothetical protein ACTMSW_04510 [Micromonospora sp. BQ11]|uniref:hypothetical protein n=1 Tax=Micromonospora sp. BQ11 TaxID=3452212 RepID=UPI003F89B9D8
MWGRRPVAVLGAVVTLLAGCAGPGRHDGGEPSPLRPAWVPLSLPAPPGPPGRLLLRDVASCAGRWYVVGGVAGADGGTRPAAWVGDGAVWSSLPTVPVTLSGEQHVFSSVACRGDRVAALGAKSGGVHGNPRTGTWWQGPDRALREVSAPFEQFGGPRAVAVARLAAGPAGWLVVGSRVDGAAAWVSPDSAAFTLVEGAAELSGDGRGRTAAYDAVGVPAGWLAVGTLLAAGGMPLAWTSADGRSWRRAELPGGPGTAQRVVVAADGPVVVGPAGGVFAAWRSGPDGWRRVGGFGVAGPGVPSVVGLAAAGGALMAATATGSGHGLWLSADSGHSWQAMAMPVVVAQRGDTAVAVASDGDRLLMVADDAQTSRAWSAGLASVDR